MSRSFLSHEEFVPERTARAVGSRNPITNPTGDAGYRTGESAREKVLRERNDTQNMFDWTAAEPSAKSARPMAAAAPWATSADVADVRPSRPISKSTESSEARPAAGYQAPPERSSSRVFPGRMTAGSDIFHRGSAADEAPASRMAAAPAPFYTGDAAEADSYTERSSSRVVPGRMTAGSDIFGRDAAPTERSSSRVFPGRMTAGSDIFHTQEADVDAPKTGRSRAAPSHADNDIFGRDAVAPRAAVAPAAVDSIATAQAHASENRNLAAEYRRRGQGSFQF